MLQILTALITAVTRPSMRYSTSTLIDIQKHLPGQAEGTAV